MGPYGVGGLSSLRSGRDWVDLTFGRSPCHLGVPGARIEVILRVRRVLLCGNARVASRSRDSFGFRNEGVVSGGGGFGGGIGGVGACSGVLGGCTVGGEVGSGSGGVGSPMWGAVVGTREQEGMVLVLGSWFVGTHPVLYILVPCQSPLPNLCVLPVVLRARMRAVRSCRFDRAPFGDRAPRGAHTTRRACRRGSPYRIRGAPVVGRVHACPARPFVRVWLVPPPRSPFVFRPERGCTRRGPPRPPLGSARAGRLPTAGVHEVGMRIEGV